MWNCARSTTSPTIQFPGPWAERGRWRRKTWTRRRVGLKRRRKRRIAKSGRGSVHAAHWWSPPTDALWQQDSNACSRSAPPSGPHRQRSRDECGSQAEEGRERNQYVCSLRVAVSPPAPPPPTLLTLLLLSLQTPSKTARAPVHRATLRSLWKRRRARDPNLPARRRQSRWNLSERPQQPKRSILSLWFSPRCTEVTQGPQRSKDHQVSEALLTRFAVLTGIKTRQGEEREEGQQRRKGGEKTISLTRLLMFLMF